MAPPQSNLALQPVGYGVAVDEQAGSVKRGLRTVALRPKTAALLSWLLRNPHRHLRRDELIAALWPNRVVVDDSLTQCVTELRRAFGPQAAALLRTLPRVGYCFEPQDDTIEMPPLQQCWALLGAHRDAAEVDAARRGMEHAHQLDAQDGAVLAGIALSHVIDVLNRWSRSPQWQTEIARVVADEAHARAPELAMAAHARAHVALLQCRHAEARAGFMRALQLDPSLDRARLRLAVIELELGRADEALAQLPAGGHIAGDRPLLAQVEFVRGMIHFHRRDHDQAWGSLGRAIQADRDAVFAYQWRAAIAALRGDEGTARGQLGRFRAKAPWHTLASLRATERSHNPVFRAERERFYEGLRRAGLPA